MSTLLVAHHSTLKMSTRIYKRNSIAPYLTLLLLLVGCKTQFVEVEKPVVVEHTSVQHHTDIVRDTLIMRDSVYHLIKGDTLVIERWHYTTQVNKVVVADTVRDSIPIIKEVKVPVEVERQMTKWEKTKMDMGGLAIGALLFGIISIVVYLIVKLRKMAK